MKDDSVKGRTEGRDLHPRARTDAEKLRDSWIAEDLLASMRYIEDEI